MSTEVRTDEPSSAALTHIMSAQPDVLAEVVRRVQRAVGYLDHLMGPDSDFVISEGLRFSLQAIKASLIEADPVLPEEG